MHWARSDGVAPKADRRRGWLFDVILALGLACSVLVPFWPVLTQQMTIVDGDFTEEYFPLLLTARRALEGGELPLWNPLSNGGQPLLADPQLALFYPPTWWALAGTHLGDLGSLVALQGLAPLHLSIAAVSAFVLGRVMLGGRLAAVLVAVVYTYSGFLTSYPIEQLPILRTAAWFPLQLAFLWLALARRSWVWRMAAGGVFGVAILAGHPQTAFLEAIGAALVTFVWIYRARSDRRDWTDGRDWTVGADAALTLVVMMVVGFGIAAVQVLPTLEFARVSNRSGVDYTFLAGGFTFWELPMDLVSPRILGGRPPYVGLGTLVLACVGVVAGRSPVRPVALTLMIFGLVLSTGAHTFAYAALYNLVPGFNVFRGQERSIILFTLGSALLAGHGLMALLGIGLRLRDRDLARVIMGVAWAVLLTGALWGALYWRSMEQAAVNGQRWAEVTRWSAFSALMLIGFLAILTLHRRVRATRAVVPFALVMLVSVDLVAMGWHAHFQERRPEEVYVPSSMITRMMQDLNSGRVYDEWVLKGNHGQVFDVPTVTRTFPIRLERFELATNQLAAQALLLNPDRVWTVKGLAQEQDRLFDLLNVRYLTTWRAPTPDQQPLVQESSKDGPHYLYARSALGPAWVVNAARFANGPDHALRLVSASDFDPRTSVVLESASVSEPTGLGRVHSRQLSKGVLESASVSELTGDGGRVLAYERRFNRVEITAESDKGGYLVISEPTYPGWRAEIDGVETPLMPADYLLQAVRLPPGRHRVTLTMQAGSLYFGMAITATTMFVLASVLVRAFVLTTLARRRQNGQPSPQPSPSGERE